MSVHVRKAAPFDTGAMAALLNAIIAEGSTTAITEPATAEGLRDYMTQPGMLWHVAEVGGDVVGFQWIEAHEAQGRCEIATFVDARRHGLGIGSALFKVTQAAARKAGHAWINAEIRADNEGGLAYYRSRGFETYGTREGVELADGRVVNKVLTRFDL
jgi:ribosomal protein S18 acetylase RimI-like enzyme